MTAPLARIAQVLRLPVPERLPPVPVLDRPGNSAPMPANDEPRKWPPRPPLGDKALEWCRLHIPNFASHERQVQESEAHRKKLLEAVRS